MKSVRLKNGTEEMAPLVITVSMHVENLLGTNPIAFYELVMVCRDPTHKPFGNTGEVLKKLALMDPSGRIHDSIRNVVLSGSVGNGLDMSWANPAAE